MLLEKVTHRGCEVVVGASTGPPFAIFELEMFTCTFPYTDLWPSNGPYANRGKQVTLLSPGYFHFS